MSGSDKQTSAVKEQGVFYIFATLTLSAVFLSHQYFILPVEQVLFGIEIASMASLMFLPHGAKVLFAVISGHRSFLPILSAQYLGGLFYGLTAIDALIAASIGCLAIFLPLAVLSTQRWLWPSQNSDLTLFQKLLIISLSSSIMNSTLISIYQGHLFKDGISLRFLFGDILGTIAVFAILILCRGWLYQLIVPRVLARINQSKRSSKE